MKRFLMVLMTVLIATSSFAGPKLVSKKVKNGKDGQATEFVIGFDGVAQFKFPSSCGESNLTQKQDAVCKAWTAFRIAAAEANIDLRKK